MPLGAQSVLAASANAPGQVTYVPVPIATVPDPTRPPMPPVAKLPEPPQPNAYVNAFSPPPVPQNNQPQNPMTANAFSNMSQPMYQMTQRPPQAPAYGPSYVPYPPGPMAQANAVPAFAPVPQPVQPIQFNAPAAQPTFNPAMDRRQAPISANPAMDMAQILQVLRASPYPAQREWAANTLSTYDWRGHPEAVQTLLQAAKEDPAATVRASCVYSLGRMNAASEPVITTLSMLRNDGDPRVRQEVEQALARLGANRK
jgi:hypothetical protein